MSWTQIIVDGFIGITKGIAGLVSNFGKPVADILHSIFSFIPQDALVGSGILIIVGGYASYKLIDSHFFRAIAYILLGSVLLIVVSNPQQAVNTFVSNATNTTGG